MSVTDKQPTLIDRIERRKEELRREAADAEDLLEIRYYDGAIDEAHRAQRIISRQRPRAGEYGDEQTIIQSGSGTWISENGEAYVRKEESERIVGYLVGVCCLLAAALCGVLYLTGVPI